MTLAMTGVTIDLVQSLMDEHFPHGRLVIEALDADGARVRKRHDDRHLRPGGTVSGPTLMALADASMYVALLGRLGLVLDSVTSSLTIHFLKRPRPNDLIADARVIKVGRQLAVGDVWLYSEGIDTPVAHATVTYSLPRTDNRDDAVETDDGAGG